MKRGLAVLLIFVMILLLCPDTGRTDESTAGPLSFDPILPSDNIGGQGYHIEGQPGETVALQAKLSNLTNHTIQLAFVALNAYSSPEGIFYQSPDQIDPQTVALADGRGGLAQYINMADTVLLVAGMSAILTVKVTIPEMDTGVLLGGFRVMVTEAAQDEPCQSIDTTIQIDLPSAVEPSVVAGGMGLTDQFVSIPVVNQTAAIVQNVSAAYEIRDEHGAIVLEGGIVLPEMAPLSEYHILQSAENQPWEDGPYTLNMQINTDGQKVDFSQTFTVGEGNAPEFGVLQEIKPAVTAANPQETESAGVAESPQETGLAVAAANLQTHEEALAAPDDGLNHTVVSCFVFGIPAVFMCIIVWMYHKNRKRGKHERPSRWVINSSPAAGGS